MIPPGGSSPVFRFGPFGADPRTRELRKGGVRVRLRDKSFQVLIALLEHPGDVVTRDELRRRLWPQGVFVDFENSLNSTVNRLREVLGDSTAKPRFIETVPRVGYRFVGPVEPQRPAQPTLAVLPFENLNHDAGQDFFADGVTDALITALGGVSTLRVISRQSVLHLRGTQETVPEIARELKADVIVEGALLQAGGRIRITAQLVQARPERHLWAKGYECAAGDILTVQGEVAQAIAEAVQVALAPTEKQRLSRPRPVNPEAYRAYLMGRHHMGQWSRQSFERALDCFRDALARDPAHAPAYAHMADCYALLGYWGHLPFREAYQQAKQAALKALALDDTLSSAHWAFAWATWVCDWNLAACEAETLRAIQLNPSDEHAHAVYSVFLITTSDNPARAVSEMKLALDLDPLSHYVNANMAWIYLFVRDYENAVAQALRTLDLFPGSLLALQGLGLAELCRSRYAEAAAALEKAAAISHDPFSTAYLGVAHARRGDRDLAGSLLQQLLQRSQREPVPPRCFVFLYASLGEQDRALEWLENAYAARDTGLFWLRVMPLYDPLRGTARFNEMLRRMGLSSPSDLTAIRSAP